MKKFITFCGAALTALFLCPQVKALDNPVDAYLPIPTGASYSSTFSMRTEGMNWGSAQVIVTSASVTGGSFYSGSASTGNLTVVSYVALSTAIATGKITISSDTALAGSCISGGGPGLGAFNVCNPGDYAVDLLYSSETAVNLSNAINYVYGTVISTPGAGGNATGVVYTTAAYAGSAWNNFQLSVSTYGAATLTTFISSQPYDVRYASWTGVGIGHLTGGQDNQSFTINGKTFLANTDFFPVTSTAQTATNIATAITASSNTIFVAANAGSGQTTVVFATATTNGSNTNYVVSSSSNPALKISGTVTVDASGNVGTGSLTGGTTAGFLIGTSTITIAGNTFAQGEAVYLSTTSGNTVNPLIGGVTYYVMNIPPGTAGTAIMLATTQTNALTNNPIVLISSGVSIASPLAYGLTPGPLAGTPAFQWMVSNDGTHFLPYTTNPFGQSIGSFGGYGAYYSTGTINNFDFSRMDYGWLGIGFTAPTSGTINVQAHVIGKQ